MAVWGILDFLMLAAGGGMIAFAVLLKAPDAIRSLVLTDFDLNCAYLPRLPSLRSSSH